MWEQGVPASGAQGDPVAEAQRVSAAGAQGVSAAGAQGVSAAWTQGVSVSDLLEDLGSPEHPGCAIAIALSHLDATAEVPECSCFWGDVL